LTLIPPPPCSPQCQHMCELLLLLAIPPCLSQSFLPPTKSSLTCLHRVWTVSKPSSTVPTHS
jgi:hypothetical protein